MALCANTCHSLMACSTIMLGDFDFYDAADAKDFAEAMLDAFHKAEDNWDFGSEWGDDDYGEERGYSWTEMSFVVASTKDSQSDTRRFLRELGFWESEEAYNEKNCTEVTFWVIPIPKLKQKFNELKVL